MVTTYVANVSTRIIHTRLDSIYGGRDSTEGRQDPDGHFHVMHSILIPSGLPKKKAIRVKQSTVSHLRHHIASMQPLNITDTASSLNTSRFFRGGAMECGRKLPLGTPCDR